MVMVLPHRPRQTGRLGGRSAGRPRPTPRQNSPPTDQQVGRPAAFPRDWPAGRPAGRSVEYTHSPLSVHGDRRGKSQNHLKPVSNPSQDLKIISNLSQTSFRGIKPLWALTCLLADLCVITRTDTPRIACMPPIFIRSVCRGVAPHARAGGVVATLARRWGSPILL
jgi:hypothetical protein